MMTNSQLCGILVMTDPLQPEWMLVECDIPVTDQYICSSGVTHSSGWNFASLREHQFITQPQHRKERSINLFLCEDGTAVPEAFVCNGKIDCPNKTATNFTDESNCSCILNNITVFDSEFCFSKCHRSNCLCRPQFYQCVKGGCIQWSLLILVEYVPTNCANDVNHFLLPKINNFSEFWYDCNQSSIKVPHKNVSFDDLVPDLPNVRVFPILCINFWFTWREVEM